MIALMERLVDRYHPIFIEDGLAGPPIDQRVPHASRRSYLSSPGAMRSPR
jgi:hypothetical protein